MNNAKKLTATLPEPIHCRPFVKWAGGKTQLLAELLKRVPEKFDTYHEPFLGGGALFFALQPEIARLTDCNQELINTYQAVRENVELLIEELSLHVYESEHFYSTRAADRLSSFSKWSKQRRAARFIYLNKTCFNGLYRVNSKGLFNVPFGRYKNPKFCDKENLLACSYLLQGKDILLDTFESVLENSSPGDFVYFDPPYIPLSETASFTAYNEGGFSMEQQIKLKNVCDELNKKNVKFMLSNSSNPEVHKLYRGYNVETVLASRAINSNASARGPIEEVIVRNYK